MAWHQQFHIPMACGVLMMMVVVVVMIVFRLHVSYYHDNHDNDNNCGDDDDKKEINIIKHDAAELIDLDVICQSHVNNN